MSTNLERKMKYTKEDDFKLLEEASITLTDWLRVDEGNLDLEEQFNIRDQGHHQYFDTPSNVVRHEWEAMLFIKDFFPIPRQIQDAIMNQSVASFMGILPEINRAWVTVDNRIYFWNYLRSEEVELFDDLNDVVISVALSAPKPGIFLESVKYVIAVATTVEVILLAVSWNGIGADLRIIPTSFTISSDGIIMQKVVGSQSGRIFMAGQDGNLHELSYDNHENRFASLLGFDGMSQKCQKFNHTAWSWKKVLIPPFIRSVVGWDESMVDLCVDDVRHILYCVTSKNSLRVVHLGAECASVKMLIDSFSVLDEVKAYLKSPVRAGDASTGSLPHLDSIQRGEDFAITGVFVIPITESKRVHVLVVLHSGVRVYLRLVDTSGYRSANPSAAAVLELQSARLEIVHVRGPPTNRSTSSATATTAAVAAGLGLQDTSIRLAHYSHGVFLLAMEHSNSVDSVATVDPTRRGASDSNGNSVIATAAAERGDEIVGITEDLSIRVTPISPAAYRSGQAPCMREIVCSIADRSGNSIINSKVYDIKEDCRFVNVPDLAAMRALYTASATPVPSSINEMSHWATNSTFSNAKLSYLASSAAYSPALLAAGHQSWKGISNRDLNFVVQLNEFALQAMPSSLQRQFLCLTSFGLCTLIKNRPIDYFVKTLSTGSGNPDDSSFARKVESIFLQFGSLQSSGMCIELACGITDDVTEGCADGVYVADQAAIRDRALRVLRKFGGSPAVESAGMSQSQAAVAPSVLSADYVSGSCLGSSSSAPLVGKNDSFSYSVAHDAFYLVAGRLLRALWLRPVVSDSAILPMWTPSIITKTRGKIEKLRRVLADFYPGAVRSDPRSKLSSLSELESDGHTTAGGGLLTRRMQLLQAHIYQDPQKMLQQHAIDREDLSVNILWRLLTRSSQALALIEILSAASRDHKISVAWQYIVNISFRSLVVCSSSHEKVRRVIRGFSGASVAAADERLIQTVERLALQLTEECYSYFSPGDHYALEAARQAGLIKKYIDASMDVKASAKIKAEAAQKLTYLLLKATRFWNRLEDVKDSADGTPSELSKYCELLEGLGAIGRAGIVRLCLSAAETFGAPVSMISGDSKEFPGSGTSRSGSAWDKSLYHSTAAYSDSQLAEARDSCYKCLLGHVRKLLQLQSGLGGGSGTSHSQGSSSSSSSSSSSIGSVVSYADPATVSEEPFREMACDILSCARKLPRLQRMLFDLLLSSNPDELMRLDALEVEAYLLEQDPGHNFELLYRYFEHHHKFKEAANHLYAVAHREGDVLVEERMRQLQRTVLNASRACSENAAATIAMHDVASYSDFLKEVQDELAIAGFQADAIAELQAQVVEASRSQSGSSVAAVGGNYIAALSDMIGTLQFKFVSISELFNEVALPFRLWELALFLIQYSGLDAPDAAKKLWRSVIYRKIPLEASSTEASIFLMNKRAAGSLFYDEGRQMRSGNFEDTEKWAEDLERDVVVLGRRIYAITSECTYAELSLSANPFHSPSAASAASMGSAIGYSSSGFPIDTVVGELEDIAAALALAGHPLGVCWPGRICLQVGVSHSFLGGAYMQALETLKSAVAAPEKIALAVSSCAFLLVDWVGHVYKRDKLYETERLRFFQAIRSGVLWQWLDVLSREANIVRSSRVGGSRTVSIRLDEAADCISKVKHAIAELTTE